MGNKDQPIESKEQQAGFVKTTLPNGQPEAPAVQDRTHFSSASTVKDQKNVVMEILLHGKVKSMKKINEYSEEGSVNYLEMTVEYNKQILQIRVDHNPE
jgi:hypothetical protein